MVGARTLSKGRQTPPMPPGSSGSIPPPCHGSSSGYWTAQGLENCLQPSRRERTQGRFITYQPNVPERIGKSTLSMDPPRPLVILDVAQTLLICSCGCDGTTHLPKLCFSSTIGRVGRILPTSYLTIG